MLIKNSDGDVLVYYTHLLYREVKPYKETSRPSVVPWVYPFLWELAYWSERLFHENVGNSAWGLAIHSKSRLIAVSSNLKQVSVFAFGVTGSENPNMPYQLWVHLCDHHWLQLCLTS